MPKKKAYSPGTFCYVDLASHGQGEAIDFYTALFGWQVDHQETGGGPPYALFLQDGSVVAGVGEMSEQMQGEGMPPVWNSYVSVDDAAATGAAAVEGGGRILSEPMRVMDAAWVAFCADPFGAAFALWQPLDAIGAGRVNEPVSLCWNELATPDLGEAQAFYHGLFGWSFEEIESPAPTPVAQIKNDEVDNGHFLQMNEAWEGIDPHWAVYFAVADADATCARCEELGGSVSVQPFDISAGRTAVLTDPQGAHFYVIELR